MPADEQSVGALAVDHVLDAAADHRSVGAFFGDVTGGEKRHHGERGCRGGFSANRIDEESEWKHDAVSNMEDRPESLQEHLLEQFRFFNSSPEVREFGEFLIQNLDSNGRLPSPLPELCQVYGKAISPDAAREALAWREAYRADGTSDYESRGERWAGDWHVSGEMFCTFYRGVTSGGCWYVRQVSDNCYHFFIAGFGIDVVIIQPGLIKTGFGDAAVARRGARRA